MKQTKRILGMLLSLCLVLGMLPGVASAASSSQFTDVNPWDWYYEAVRYVSGQGLMNGTSTTTFEPDTTTTRGMIVTILYRMEGSPSYTNKSFTDVPAGEWYAPAVSWANTYSIVKGYGDGTFGPNDPITREQLALVLFRYAQLKKYNTSMTGDLSKYSDKAQISSYDGQIALSWALGKGVLTAADSGLLEPKTAATRALAAYALKGFADNVVGTGAAGLVPSNWTSNSTPQPAPAEEETTYTVSFYLNYGKNELYEEKTVVEGNTVDKPTAPRRTNYRFLGWYESSKGLGRSYDFSTAVTSDVSLYAKWEQTDYSRTSWLRYWDGTTYDIDGAGLTELVRKAADGTKQYVTGWVEVDPYWYGDAYWDDYYWSDYYRNGYYWDDYYWNEAWLRDAVEYCQEHTTNDSAFWQYWNGSKWVYLNGDKWQTWDNRWNEWWSTEGYWGGPIAIDTDENVTATFYGIKNSGAISYEWKSYPAGSLTDSGMNATKMGEMITRWSKISPLS